MENYGALKAACETVVDEVYGDRGASVRAGPDRRAVRPDRPVHVLAAADRRRRRRARPGRPVSAGAVRRRPRSRRVARAARARQGPAASSTRRGRPSRSRSRSSSSVPPPRSGRTRASSGSTSRRCWRQTSQPWTELPLWLPGDEYAGMARSDTRRGARRRPHVPPARGDGASTRSPGIARSRATARRSPGRRSAASWSRAHDRTPRRSRPPARQARAAARVYDRATIEAILDEALVCHLGFEVDGQPYVIPTLHARIDDRLYVHGSAASRMLRHAASELRVCVTVTLLDGLVLARSVFNHSINYRSVVVLGIARGSSRTTRSATRCTRSPSTSHRVAGRKRGSRPTRS